MKTSATITRQQSIEETSVQELDIIYYPGYAQQMMETDPERLQWEIKEFERQFSKKN